MGQSKVFPGEMSLTAHSLWIRTSSFDEAFELVRSQMASLAVSAKKLDKFDARIFYPGCQQPFRVLAAMVSNNSDPMDLPNQSQNLLLGADYARIHEFLLEQRLEGNIVIITSNTTNLCYHTNDLLRPERGVYKPHQWTGYNYLNSWRETLGQLERLQSLLHKEGEVKGYEYQLYRPDNAFCTYSTDYYLCRDYLGDEVRIGVSRPQDWSILREPQPVSM